MQRYMLVALLSLVCACSNSGKKDRYDIEPDFQSRKTNLPLPTSLEISLSIDNYLVKDYEVINQYATDIEFGQRFSDGYAIVMSFYPVPQNGQYWLAKIPPIESGTVNIDATLYSGRINLPKGLLPPDDVIIDIAITNKAVARHYIENSSERTMGLYYKGAVILDGDRFGVIQSQMFPEEQWGFRFPKRDGRFSVIARRQE